MEIQGIDLEAVVLELNDDAVLADYKRPYDNYQTGLVPKLFGSLLVFCGNLVYGKEPSYEKFKAVEVIARIPYHSWESVIYTLLTVFYSNEQKAISLSNMSAFSRLAQDNETMHVVVISQIVHRKHGNNFILHTFIPFFFSFFYFWAIYTLYFFSPKSSLEMNYLFEQHAFDQYSRFLELYGDELKKKPVESSFLRFYGRNPKNEYELFRSIRNDEIIHRNRSIREIEMRKGF